MKASDYIISFLVKQQVKHIFGYIGGAITHLVDSAYKAPRLSFIQVYHEQTAAIAAEGVARATNSLGVAMATSGPGATNLITGIADAYLDSVPVLFITGQVNTHEYKYTKQIRQQGFQETDIVSIVKPITKYAALVDDPSTLKFHLEKAVHLALEGRKGPVLLDIPMDVQRAMINPRSLSGYTPPKVALRQWKLSPKVQHLLTASRRPLILVGGGVRLSGAEKEVLRFAKRHQVPVVSSLMGKGCFPEDDPLFVGMLGSYGNRCANMVTANADLLIALGSRLDTRQTGTRLASFIHNGNILHVDIDPNELKYHRLKNRVSINTDVKTFLQAITTVKTISPEKGWLEYVQKIKTTFGQAQEVQKSQVNTIPYKIMQLIDTAAKKDQIITVDIGQNQMFAAQSIHPTLAQRFFTSGGLAPMGYALPLAIGLSFAAAHKKSIFAIAGDGGFHISTQSLMLLSQYKLPIKALVLNNASLGMITQFQDLYFGHKKCATTAQSGYLVPDLGALAKAYALPYARITPQQVRTVPAKLKKLLRSPGPALIEFVIQPPTVVVPKLEVDRPLEEISPLLPKNVLKSYMLHKDSL